MSTPMRRMCSPCCASAASGKVAAEPSIPLMKSRRRIADPSECARQIALKEAVQL
jgi:hypothetical protein